MERYADPVAITYQYNKDKNNYKKFIPKSLKELPEQTGEFSTGEYSYSVDEYINKRLSATRRAEKLTAGSRTEDKEVINFSGVDSLKSKYEGKSIQAIQNGLAVQIAKVKTNISSYSEQKKKIEELNSLYSEAFPNIDIQGSQEVISSFP